MKPGTLIAGALACFTLAAVLGLLAADISGWRGALRAGDVRYRGSPGQVDLWLPATLIPHSVSRWALAVGDDLAFRRAVRSVFLSRLNETTGSDPELALLRNEAQARLEVIVAGDSDPGRRARAANLIGVLNLARLASETQEPAPVLESAIASFEEAIALDPASDEPKHNLELALQRGRGMKLEESAGGDNPTPGGRGASGAGASAPGSGY